jgi:hypothetical protein
MTAPEVTLLQTGPETFTVWVHDRTLEARLAHRTRRGLGLVGVPPLEVAREMVRFLLERDALPAASVDLGPAVGRFPEFSEELRARLG